MGKKNDSVGTHGSCVRPQDGSCVQSTLHPKRKSPRATFHDYSGGDYFVTICTEEKEHFFGEIVNGEMLFSEIGNYCEEQLRELQSHYPYCEPIIYVVMPNHIHAILSIDGDDERTHGPCVPTKRTLLSVAVGGFKSAVTRYARRNNIDFGWQSRYYDHIIRGMHDGNKIAEYIENNVVLWHSDCFNL